MRISSVILTLQQRRVMSDILLSQCKSCGLHDTKQFLVYNPYVDKDTFQADFIDGIELPPKYTNSINYHTWFSRPNAYNAWKCHHQIMMDFAKKSYPAWTDYILMLEDDAFIYEEEFRGQLETFFRALKLGADIPMLYFGWYSNGHLSMDDSLSVDDKPFAFKISGGAGFHGVLLRRDTVQTLLDFPPIGPYDWIAGQLQLQGTLKAYAVYPASIIQLDGHSFVEGHHLSKPARDKI